MTQATLNFDGATYDPALDRERLASQLDRVRYLLLTNRGEWFTLEVDAVNLPPEEQRMHERRLINQSRVVQAIARARTPRKIEGHRTGAQSGGMESIGEEK